MAQKDPHPTPKAINTPTPKQAVEKPQSAQSSDAEAPPVITDYASL